MQIHGIQKYTYNTPSFRSYSDIVYNNLGRERFLENIVNSSNTWFNRGLPSVKTRAEILMKEFANVPKINMYDFGCSDCSDVLSLLIHLHSIYGNEIFEKIGKITCVDKNGAPIYRAEMGTYVLTRVEVMEINEITSGNFDKYFYSEFGDKYNTSKWYINSFIKSLINPEVGDVMDEYTRIEPFNSFVQARNFWPYLSEDEKEALAQNLHRQMKGNSLLVIGNIDKDDLFGNRPADKFLIDAGFVEHPQNEYIYRVQD